MLGAGPLVAAGVAHAASEAARSTAEVRAIALRRKGMQFSTTPRTVGATRPLDDPADQPVRPGASPTAAVERGDEPVLSSSCGTDSGLTLVDFGQH
ncbi:MAG TPA: hypothetical protein VFZ92_39955 [Umezawaea sp.]